MMVTHCSSPPRQTPHIAGFANLNPSILVDHVSPTNSTNRAILKCHKNPGKPVGMWDRIIIDKCNYIGPCCGDSGAQCRDLSWVLYRDLLHRKRLGLDNCRR